jgi:hypothetical protein
VTPCSHRRLITRRFTVGPDNVAHFRPLPPEQLKAAAVRTAGCLLFLAPMGAAAALERQLELDASEAAK